MTGDGTASFQPGSKVGNYILDAYVGGGSFGVVWRGHQQRDSQPVAIKLLTGNLSSADSAAMRADIELLAAAAAERSEHVVKVLGGGAEPVPYIVMEFIEGSDLLELLNVQGRLTIAKTIEVGLAIADALRALYEVGIVHSDIKPANVMIDREGVIKLADFGIAKIIGYNTVTTGGAVAMTMAYAAPEIWEEGGSFGRPSHKSDLYAMGVLLYQCLTGAAPFSGNYGALYRAHTEVPPDIKVLPVGTPASLRILLRRCMEKAQDERPREAGECVAILQRADAELAESMGRASAEPRRFGSWLKGEPHEIVPWAWHCRSERTGTSGTVEVHFFDRLELGETLAEAVEANPTLVAVGAERLIESNRLLLRPGEAWSAAPAGQFQFWVAREDLPVQDADVVSEPTLLSAVSALSELIDTAAGRGIQLDLSGGSLSVLVNGGIYVRRPGLSHPEVNSGVSAMRGLRRLPLDGVARTRLDLAADFDALRSLAGHPVEAAQPSRMTSDADATVVAQQRVREQTVSGPGSSGFLLAPPRREQPPAAVEKNRPWVLVAAAAGGALVVGIGALLLLGGGSKSDDTKAAAVATTAPVQATAPTVVASVAARTVVVPAVVPTNAPIAAPVATAAPALPSRAEILSALDHSNQVYITAFRSGDINILGSVFTGQALAYYQDSMRKMLARSERQENQILQTDYLDFQTPNANSAIVRTRERWSYRVVGGAAAKIYNYNEYYELVKVNQTWIVSVNTFQEIP